MRILPAALAAASVTALAACSAASSTATAPASSAPAAAAAAPSPACTLKPAFDYIVRDALPGSVTAEKIGNVNLASCTDTLSGFAATAGQASGECTTIALAAKNPGYDVNASDPAPLKDVIEKAGPGC